MADNLSQLVDLSICTSDRTGDHASTPDLILTSVSSLYSDTSVHPPLSSWGHIVITSSVNPSHSSRHFIATIQLIGTVSATY